MRSHLRLLPVATLAAALFSSSLAAQEPRKGRGGMGSPEQRIERLEEAVGALTAEQKEKIKAIYTKSAEQVRALPEDERRGKMMEIMQDSGRQVRAVLNAEQQQKYDEMMARMRQGGGERRRKN